MHMAVYHVVNEMDFRSQVRDSTQREISLVNWCRLCTYWLSGRAGRENIWLEVMAVRNERSEVRTEWPRAKYFSVRPDLTQSISILSYDKIRIFCFKQVRTPFWAGRTAFYCPLTKTRTAPITWLFCMVFIRAARAGKYGHMINHGICWAGKASFNNSDSQNPPAFAILSHNISITYP